ncbi:GNAT family N-acetyltransferase [Terrarubrum flagellatum]|uniref:GNAT family N-acetyltransferase n=1 Tax=Terrirubrum flagellatum TaxID=2895980 RepID=UPI003144D842
MQVDVISDRTALEHLKPAWESIYAADPEAHFFLSWTWMAQYLPTLEDRWFILAARPEREGAGYAALFPLRISTGGKEGLFHNEINMAGNYAADYTGFICLPSACFEAAAAFAKRIREMRWSRFKADFIRAGDRRFDAFFSHFVDRELRMSTETRVNVDDNVDNCICPMVRLPEAWDAYLETLSSNTRPKLRRFLKMIDRGELRVTHADESTIARDVDRLLDLWKARWGDRKGDRLDAILTSNRRVLGQCLRDGALFMPVLWAGDRAVGALAILLDRVKKTMLFYISGRDDSFTSPPPGFVLHAYAIHHAIAEGFTSYDFLRGDEPYKYMFGAENKFIKCVIVSTRNGRNLGDRLEPRTIPFVLSRATNLHQKGSLVEAMRAYRQILHTDPNHAETLFRGGQLLTVKRDFAGARSFFKQLLHIRPDSAKAWLHYGKSCEALGKLKAAAAAYAEAARIEPKLEEARIALDELMKHAPHTAGSHTGESRISRKNNAPSGQIWRSRVRPSSQLQEGNATNLFAAK